MISPPGLSMRAMSGGVSEGPLCALRGVAGTVNLTHIKRHYYESHKTINPTGIVPVGPELGWG